MKLEFEPGCIWHLLLLFFIVVHPDEVCLNFLFQIYGITITWARIPRLFYCRKGKLKSWREIQVPLLLSYGREDEHKSTLLYVSDYYLSIWGNKTIYRASTIHMVKRHKQKIHKRKQRGQCLYLTINFS